MKATYRLEVEYIQSLRMREGEYRRGTCPFCSGRNTFGVTYRQGVYKWGCYRASCLTQGFLEGKEGIDSILARVGSDHALNPVRTSPMPSMLTPIETQTQGVAWLKSVNTWESIQAGLISIKYDPVEDRIAFPVYSDVYNHTEDTLCGYTSRGRKGDKPKWKKFGDTNSLFSCGRGRVGVLVEDAPSACAVGIIPEYVGCSLLGTNLTTSHILQLRRLDKVIVALDADAVHKQDKMLRLIGGNCSSIIIDEDLKYKDKDQIKEILNG